jgi:hypothetical protein
VKTTAFLELDIQREVVAKRRGVMLRAAKQLSLDLALSLVGFGGCMYLGIVLIGDSWYCNVMYIQSFQHV